MAPGIRTAEELERAGDIGRCELIRGDLIMMIPPGGRHGQLASFIGYRLMGFAGEKNLGTVLAETGFVLSRDPDTVRAPDVAFLRPGREIGDGFIDGAPDLAVEVTSPGDRSGEIREKVAEWLEAGAETVWQVDPRKRTVVVHCSYSEPQVLAEHDVLRGGRVLPGFELPLVQLF